MSSLSAKIRDQIISSFRAELSEHLQTMNSGLLAVEQGTVSGEERTETLHTIFRAAHSLKGAARAVGVTIIEQMAHTLESALDALQKNTLQPSAALFTACYKTLDAIEIVQQTYENGETTPPIKATQAILELQQVFSAGQPAHPADGPAEENPDAEDPPRANGRNKKGKKTSAAERMKGALQDVMNVKDEPEALSASAPVESETKKNDAPPVPERRSPASDSEVLRTRADDGETVRVKVGRLDTLMDHLNELLIVKIRTQQRLEQITNVKTGIANLEKEWQFVRSAYAHRIHTQSTELEKTSKDEKKILNYTMVSQEQVHNSNHELNIVARELASDISQMTLAIDELEQEVKSLRMLPLSTITAAFPRMVRDLANEHNKEIIFQVKGADTELDKHVMEQIKDPLIHLLRNAIDHGIESPAQRVAAGKISAGLITLSAEQVGKDIIIKVSDDGMGLDMDALRKSVTRLGVDTSQLDDAELQQYIFEPGITTNRDVTNTSGRGMGLDIVQTNLEDLHGTCEMASSREAGTTFTLTIPLRLTGSRGLMVKSSGQLFALPINAVEYIRSIRKNDVALLEGHDVIYHNQQPIALLWLCDVLDLPRTISFSGNTELSVIILKNSDRRIAFIVDELAGEQEIVVKGLGDQLIRIAGLAGATILGTGEVVLILNPKDLMAMAIKGGYTSAMKLPAMDNKTSLRENRPMHRILVVDDSITTRTLEKNILEAAGYNVELATDGQEALNMVSAGSQPDLIISDVSMPRVGGLELTRRMKSNSQTAQIPIILVSSMDSTDDKMQGMEAGADAYISKGGFDQGNLLETIEKIITPEGVHS